MKLARLPRRPPGETIIPLIDVVFFLLVFAMLTGRMDATAPFEMLPPVSESDDELPAGGITLTIGPAGELALDGATVSADEAIAAIGRRIGGGHPELMVRVNADRDAPLRTVLPLLSRIEETGTRNIVFVVTKDG